MEFIVTNITDRAFQGPPCPGEIGVTGLADLARQLDAVTTPGQVHTLHVLDQGFRGGLQLGEDWITKSSLARFADDIDLIAPALAQGAKLILHNSQLDARHPLLRQMAARMDVSIETHRTIQHPGLRRRVGFRRGGPNPFGAFGQILARAQAI